VLSTPVRTEVGAWSPRAPAAPTALVVVAPHPDDEVLGAAGIMRWCQDLGTSVTVVACTDGEASHAGSHAVTPAELRRRRRRERAEALEVLGLEVSVRELGLDDGGLVAQVPLLVAALAGTVGVDATLLVPWEHDDHPDHRAVAEAGAAVATLLGVPLWRVPIWGKVRRDRPLPPHAATLALAPGHQALKAAAVAAFGSQLVPLGPGPLDGPVLHSHELDRMLDGTEVLLW
jgi:LmbE family N-acetylglucosaminyl deacetylase